MGMSCVGGNVLGYTEYPRILSIAGLSGPPGWECPGTRIPGYLVLHD